MFQLNDSLDLPNLGLSCYTDVQSLQSDKFCIRQRLLPFTIEPVIVHQIKRVCTLFQKATNRDKHVD